MTYDAVVVGIGVAGLTAALRLAEHGRCVLVVAKGVASTHLAPGRLDILGYATDGQRIERPAAALGAFLAERPDHPYARVGARTLRESAEWFRARLGYVGSADENLLLPTAVGAAKPTAVVPPNAVGGDVRTGGRFLIVGLQGLKDFFPALCAANLQRAAPVRARAVELHPPLGGEHDVNGLGFAGRFEDERFREAVVRELRITFAPGERVGFPAVLGLREAEGVWRELEERLRTRVFEIPTLPPSVPGIRMFESLRSALRAAGARIVVGDAVIRARTSGRRVDAVVAEAAGRTVEYSGESFVLATGGFASGGLELGPDGAARETVLGLPVAGLPPHGQRFSPEYLGEQPFARAGLAVDERLRPLGEDGNVVYENLYAAGATLGGAEPWREASGEGISVATGFAAAEAIVQSTAR
ncbi:MAG: glycerol-3-phosphate dehydrogenase subunit GlpB [Actinomycetota bacterium]|nr:glycerol-3-phosphate dehydrogenase subunit GlpB [Actinomycetota bacterium]